MTESIDTAALRRRVYDAARTPAIRLTPTTLALAADGGVFHLNGAEADEITDAVMAIVESILDERDHLARRLKKATLPTTWTDQDGTVYDLTRPLRDQDGNYWHHVGWITRDETMPLMAWTLTPDPLGVSKRWADVSMLRAIIEDAGPLTTAEPEGTAP